MKSLIFLILLTACVPISVPRDQSYQLTVEETAYMVGCIEMAQRAHYLNYVVACADMDETFIKRHKRPGL